MIRVADFEAKKQQVLYLLKDGKEVLESELPVTDDTKESPIVSSRVVRINAGSGEVHRGFVLDTIPPELGSEKGIAMLDVAANNVVCLQEAKRRIEVLETENIALKARLDSIEERLAKIEGGK